MKPLTETERSNILSVERNLLAYPTYEGTKRRKRFCEWLQNKTFPFKFSIDTAGYFREDKRTFNRLAAELICAEIDYDLNYKKDYFHITLTSEDQITVYEDVMLAWVRWWFSKNSERMEFSDMFIGSGLVNKMIEEGE